MGVMIVQNSTHFGMLLLALEAMVVLANLTPDKPSGRLGCTFKPTTIATSANGGLYAQYAGEDETGGLPTKKMYLAGVDYSSSYQNMPFQLYTEWADTRTNR